MSATMDPSPGPAATACTSELCWLLPRASHVLTTMITAALEDVGISPRAHAVLSAARTGEHTQIEIARIVGLDKTTMVVTLDELQEAGLAERRPSATDRRARVIAVTAEGERKVQQAAEIAARVRDEALAVLPEAERAVFVSALERLVEELGEPVRCSQPVRRPRARA